MDQGETGALPEGPKEGREKKEEYAPSEKTGASHEAQNERRVQAE